MAWQGKKLSIESGSPTKTEIVPNNDNAVILLLLSRPLHSLPARRIDEKAMAPVNEEHLHEEKLTGDAQKAAQGCRDFLLQARYRLQGDYEICDDDGLKEHSSAFYTQFAPSIKV